ncbi:hypothetical protein HDV00_010279 [Rhizophlyctis rosea]|nr:hypothetical protein HDV00_010279 [Rhizophlyctis rosea]
MQASSSTVVEGEEKKRVNRINEVTNEVVKYTTHHLKPEIGSLYRLTRNPHGPLYVSSEGKQLLLKLHPSIPAPSPLYFVVHAALGRVLHASGLATELEQLIDEAENGVVSDGGPVAAARHAMDVMLEEGWVKNVEFEEEDWE